jgi:peptidylprolyl isomerase
MGMKRALLAGAVLALLSGAAQARPVEAQQAEPVFPPPPPVPTEWRTIPPQNLLVIETTKGQILVELAPQIAPGHVERIRLLASTIWPGTGSSTGSWPRRAIRWAPATARATTRT